MIIQTGMRTDIPAFYSQWLLNRIREGYVLVRNPYNFSQVTRYNLSPDVVDLMAFCKYCYANANTALVRENWKKHDPDSAFLLGNRMPGDIIRQAQQESWLDAQLRLDI